MVKRKKHKARSRASVDVTRGAVLGLFGVGLLVGLGFAYHYATTRPDPAARCAAGHPAKVHAVLIDHSDAITGLEGQRIRQQFQRIKDSAEVGTRLLVFTSTANATDMLPSLLSVCVPSRPEAADPLFENARLLRKEFDEKFSQVIDGTLSELLTKEPQQSSPIIESLHATAQTAFGPYADGEVPMLLTIVSDMIQNSAVGSHFREEPNFERFSRLPVWPSVRPKLKGAKVDILLISRPEAKRGNVPVQSRGHQDFWDKVLTASGGFVTSIE